MSVGGRRHDPASALRSQDKLVDLRMRARYHRDRHRLYLARTSSRPTRKLEELKRARELAESRLRRAEHGDREE
jgi:hypothetical protein